VLGDILLLHLVFKFANLTPSFGAGYRLVTIVGILSAMLFMRDLGFLDPDLMLLRRHIAPDGGDEAAERRGGDIRQRTRAGHVQTLITDEIGTEEDERIGRPWDVGCRMSLVMRGPRRIE
jgi:hypothetical protein